MQKKGLTSWLFPSIGDVLFLCLFFWLLAIGSGLLNDGDTGWHIVTGRNIIDTLRIPFADPYSHTMPGTPWTAHEWLAEVIFAAVDRAAGLNGVVVLTASVICLTYLALYKYAVRIGTNPLSAVMLTTIAAMASTLHWLARPHVFSFPLTLAFIIILEDYQRGRTDRLKLLPLLMVFWVNVHGGFILGLMLLMLYAGGNLLISFLQGADRDLCLRRFKTLSAITGATLIAAFINPRGPIILYFPFHLVGREYIMDNVQEWLSPNFHEAWGFELMLVVFIALFAVSRKKPGLIEGAVALLLLHMSLYSARYIPLMALIVTPLAATRAGEALGRIGEFRPLARFKERMAARAARIAAIDSRFGHNTWVYASIAACMIIALNGGGIGNARLMDYKHVEKRFPVDALEFAMENDIQGNMFNNDSWGGYIIYRSYPEYRVFFDGRSDMYGVEFMKEYVKVARAGPGYAGVLDRYGVDWVMYNANSPICLLLAESGDWKLVYADETANILLRDIPRNRGLIEKYSGTKFLLAETDKDD